MRGLPGCLVVAEDGAMEIIAEGFEVGFDSRRLGAGEDDAVDSAALEGAVGRDDRKIAVG